jgi:BirA family biotin operon repressor/biotin-[acetyl-CoA-carboxylase] ligase
VEHFEEIDSTNTWLSARARQGADEGLVAYADFQSKGRGRLDRSWVAAQNTSLLCSILLRPALDVEELHLSVACVALAARTALVRLSGVRPEVKWPNDLMIGPMKLAGLLAEVVLEPDVAVVVGIGINLNGASDGLGATSIAEQSGVTITPRALLDILLEELEPLRANLDSAEGRARVRKDYEQALVTLGQRVRVETSDGDVHGVAQRIDEAGRLVVDVDGTEIIFGVGDVIHLRRDDVS